MARRSFTEVPYQYGDGKFGVALSQTRAGVEEHIMPMAFWELDAASSLYMPPGMSTDPKRPRVTVDGQVQLSGSFASIKSAPVAGAKTVTTTAAELFAGASRLANRYALIVNNESGLPIYIGPSGVTAASGYPVLPGDSLALTLSPSAAIAIYAISTGSAAVRVLEVA